MYFEKNYLIRANIQDNFVKSTQYKKFAPNSLQFTFQANLQNLDRLYIHIDSNGTVFNFSIYVFVF